MGGSNTPYEKRAIPKEIAAPKDSAKAIPQRLRTEGLVMSAHHRWGLSTKSYSIK
jgi:hypothetical protein